MSDNQSSSSENEVRNLAFELEEVFISNPPAPRATYEPSIQFPQRMQQQSASPTPMWPPIRATIEAQRQRDEQQQSRDNDEQCDRLRVKSIGGISKRRPTKHTKHAALMIALMKGITLEHMQMTETLRFRLQRATANDLNKVDGI